LKTFYLLVGPPQADLPQSRAGPPTVKATVQVRSSFGSSMGELWASVNAIVALAKFVAGSARARNALSPGMGMTTNRGS
jgi:hypothetical protein